MHHHLDDENGFVTPADVEAFVTDVRHEDAEYYICGPGPFMDIVQATLRTAGVPADRVHLEHFEVAELPVGLSLDGGEAVTEEVTIELERRKITVPYSQGETLLQTARMAGLRPPSSCEIGSCGTCMARLTEGSARMLNNDALEARRGGRRLGADLSGPADQPHRAGGLRVNARRPTAMERSR